MRDLRLILDLLRLHDTFPAALATLVKVEGSSYRRAGARLLLTAAGSRTGSISGGCLEEDLLARCRKVIEQRRPEVVVYDTTGENDLVWGVGLGCHGIVTLLIEPIDGPPAWAEAICQAWLQRDPAYLETTFAHAHTGDWGTRWGESTRPADRRPGTFVHVLPPPLALVVFGAGDDAQPLVRMAAEFGWEITVVDPRPAYATAERFPAAGRVVGGALDPILPEIVTDPGTAAVVMTHHYVHDLPILRALAGRTIGYLGLLGPRRRAEKLLHDLRSAGCELSPAAGTALHAPVGLDLGGDTPEAVALSILAEINAVMNRRSGQPLRERTRPIHDRSQE